MAARLLPLDEAAQFLGVTAEELTAMRSRNEIYGYRDGSSWKFKQEELERVKAERQVDLGDLPPISGGSRVEPDIDAVSDLVSEEGLGQSAVGGSTIIGKDGLPQGGESDIKLTGSKKGMGASDVDLIGGSGVGSDVQLVGAGSDVQLTGSRKGRGSDKDLPSLESDIKTESFDVGSDLKLGSERGGSGKRGGSTKVPAGADSDDFAVGSDIGTGSALNLDEDDDLVLGGPGSDVTLGAADSGINLAGVKDSGLSLDEQPLELAAGSHVESLELGEDEASSVSLSSESSNPDQATQLKADDDFLLTPVEETGEQDTDSGSQVIALDTDEFDQTAPTMLGGNLAAPLLEEEGQPMGGVDMAGAGMAPGYAPLGAAGPVTTMIGEAPETPYSIWNVLLLFLPLITLTICGMMMVDVLRGMWSWNEAYSLNSSLIEAILPKQ